MGLKESRYNFFFDGEKGAKLAFNSMTGALAQIEPNKWPIIQKLLADPNREPKNQTEKELLESLKYGGFLIDGDFDELAYLKVMNRMARFSKDLLSLTIAPTMKCNFACFYCYEVKSGLTMSKKVQEKIVDFTRKRLPGAKGLGVVWYGGEPLLAFSIIESLSEKLLELCGEGDIKYSAQIITNGYLLNPDKARRLSELGVASAQITLDGPPKIHDKRRVLANGKGTFKKILENIKTASEFMRINLRVNVDKTNMSETVKLLDLLEKEGVRKKVSIYYARTTMHSDVCVDPKDAYMSLEEFNREHICSMRELVKRGFDAWQKPKRKTNVCNADALNAFMILPEGKIHKCLIGTGTLGISCIGSVFDGDFNHNYNRWLSLDVFEEERCVNCKILPLCMGGCPAVSFGKSRETERICEFHDEDTLLEHMRLFVEYRVSLKDKTAKEVRA